jgi:hypothetical protein
LSRASLCVWFLCCSYLGYGLMAARAKVIEAGKENPNHPCFAKGSSLKYSYAGEGCFWGDHVPARLCSFRFARQAYVLFHVCACDGCVPLWGLC